MTRIDRAGNKCLLSIQRILSFLPKQRKAPTFLKFKGPATLINNIHILIQLHTSIFYINEFYVCYPRLPCT